MISIWSRHCVFNRRSTYKSHWRKIYAVPLVPYSNTPPSVLSYIDWRVVCFKHIFQQCLGNKHWTVDLSVYLYSICQSFNQETNTMTWNSCYTFASGAQSTPLLAVFQPLHTTVHCLRKSNLWNNVYTRNWLLAFVAIKIEFGGPFLNFWVLN